jgi:energy-coupling factor transporter ATP-binding protein EcfA2
VGFGRLRGVGAVAPDYELRFMPEGLTVVYGQNAAGKTTYVRALKRVCRTVDFDAEVRGNVFAEADGGANPTAKVEVSKSGQTTAQQLDLAEPPDLGLDAISVFDSRCAELYVEADNAVAYVPPELRLLARLAGSQDQMRSDIAAEAEHLKAGAPSFPELAEGTQARRLAGGLTHNTRAGDTS